MFGRPQARELTHAVAIALVGVCLLTGLISLAGFLPYGDPRFEQYDHTAYLAMARDGIAVPGRASAPPYCWRILTPMLAASLPLPLHAAFFVISAAAVAGCALGIYLLLSLAGVPHGWSLAGEVSFFSYFWAAGFSLWDYIMVDATSLLVVVVGLILLACESWPPGRRRAALACLMVIGALNKESYLALAGAAFVWWWRESPGRRPLARALHASLPILPSLAVMAALRLAIAPDLSQMKEFASYGFASVLKAMLIARMHELPRWLLDCFVDPWGPLVLVPIAFGARHALGWLKARPHFAVLLLAALAQTLVATSGGRLVILGVPVLILYSMERLRERLAPTGRCVLLVAVLFTLQFLFQYLRRTMFGMAIPPYESNGWITIAYAARMAAVAAFCVAWSLAGRAGRSRAAVEGTA